MSQSLSNQHATHHGHAHDHCAPEASELQPAENSDRGEQHDDCHESHCTFLAADETSFLLEEPVAALPLIACDTTTSQATAISIRWLADTGDPLRLPVRLHLYHEVFLN